MRIHSFAELAAIVVTDIKLIVLIWRDSSLRITFPGGRKMDVNAPGLELDALIDLAIGAIHKYCLGAGHGAPPQIAVYPVPADLTTDEEVVAWVQSVPGIVLEFKPPAGMGFSGPIPPPGQAG
jgi:hypothetical protein